MEPPTMMARFIKPGSEPYKNRGQSPKTDGRLRLWRTGALTPSNRPLRDDLEELGAGAGERGGERLGQGLGVGDAHGGNAERAGERAEVDPGIGEVHADEAIALVEGEQALLDDAVAAVIHDHHRERQLVVRRRPQR